MKDNLWQEGARAREDGELFDTDTESVTWRDVVTVQIAALLAFGAWWMGLLS